MDKTQKNPKGSEKKLYISFELVKTGSWSL